MAHIPDGVLTAPVLALGAAVAIAGCAQGLRKLDVDRIPQVAVLSAAFFVASLVHFTVGPSSVHLLLSGLIGIFLGWAAFPAVLVALFLQAILFGFGGLVSLGVNVMNMAAPAVICGAAFRWIAARGNPRLAIGAAAVLGGLGVILTALFVAFDLMLSGKEFAPAAKLLVFAHLPVAAIEAVFSAAAVAVFLRSRPESLGFPETFRGSSEAMEEEVSP
jgi:cobalt/nickel transport system permease protein